MHDTVPQIILFDSNAGCLAWSVRVCAEELPQEHCVVECTTRCFKSFCSLQMQGALPGLSGFALKNCRKRYTLLSAHLEALFKQNPGNIGQAMRVGVNCMVTQGSELLPCYDVCCMLLKGQNVDKCLPAMMCGVCYLNNKT